MTLVRHELKRGWKALLIWTLAIGAFIVPYIFVMNPAMLMIDASIGDIVLNVFTALLGMYALSGGLAGFVQDKCTWYERIILIAGGMAMIIPGLLTDVIGFVVLACIFLVQRNRSKKRETRIPA